MEREKVTFEFWRLRLRNLVSTIVQLAGFVLVFVGIYRLFALPLAAGGIDITALDPVVSTVPSIGGQGLILLVSGLVVVWLSTSPRTA